ncbi:MAG: hypothetical protein COA42_10310 [Alteromonadaceae bacterium]|nr:MAG: hypothetical protein COA42_10310 [Alteromonadaceae bacterium]
MSAQIKCKNELVRLFTSFLSYALQDSRNGELELADILGLETSDCKALESLSSDQVSAIAEKYAAFIPIDVLQINKELFSNIMKGVFRERERAEQLDEMICRGACNNMLKDFFGLRNKQIANRKRILSYESTPGRHRIISDREQHAIYQCWLKSDEIEDLAERYLHVAKNTGLELKYIYSFVSTLDKSIQNISSRHVACESMMMQ